VYVVGFGSRAIAGEHQDDRLDLVLSYPLPRRSLLGSKIGVLLAITTFFVLLSMVTIWLTGIPVDLGLDLADLSSATLMLIAFGMFFGALATFIGCWLLDRTAAIAVPTALAIGGWLLNSLAAVASWLEPVRAVSPLWWLTRRNAMVQGLDVTAFALLAGGAVVLLVAAVIVFDRRDLA
jgi:ABC-2 type transport system permease protein